MDKKQDALRKLGARLKELRQQKNLTLDQLSALSGLDSPEIAAIEAGEIDPPLTALLALSQGLGLSPSELLLRE